MFSFFRSIEPLGGYDPNLCGKMVFPKESKPKESKIDEKE